MSKFLWKWIPNVGSKAREDAGLKANEADGLKYMIRGLSVRHVWLWCILYTYTVHGSLDIHVYTVHTYFISEPCEVPLLNDSSHWVHELEFAYCNYESVIINWCGQDAMMMMMSWCLMSSDVIWHIRDKLWPMPKRGSIKSTYVRCMRV